MALSEREQKLLDELERGFYETDANLANRMKRPSGRSAKKLAGGAVLAILGLVLLIVAVVLQFAPMGAVGFLVMLAGLILASSGPSLNTSTRNQGQKPTKPATTRSSFEDRWNRRTGE
jgi:hypothetical protein